MKRTVMACSALRALAAFASLTAIVPAATAGIGGSDLLLAGRDELAQVASTDLVLLGPVESIDANNSTLVVLGQRVAAKPTSSLAIGNVVEVRGKIASDGTIQATSVSVLSASFVPGASRFLLTGIVRRTDIARGSFVVGSVSVDYTPTLHSFDASAISSGSRVLVTGIQPLAGKTFVAFSAFSAAETSGIGGSDRISGIGGSDRTSVNGIGGSDRVLSKTGIGGSDLVNGIGGSDRVLFKTGIGGSDRVNGIGGSDRVLSKTGIGGSDRVNGIGGSDRVLSKTGIGGSDRVNGIGGSDRVGVSKVGIGGSDRNGIGGSDRSLSSKTGTGAPIAQDL